jgi:hypothetical protein
MKFSNLSIILAAASLLTFTAKAQEETPIVEGPDPIHRQMNFSEDKTLIVEQPAQVVQHPGVRDSLMITTKPFNRVIRPEGPKEAPKQAPLRSEEDALRFNFLYYIIQKYKLADIVEHQE